MRELSLFTGAGGGVLGASLLGWETKGYVEIDDYCQKIIAQRIKDGLLPEAPIFGNIRTFIRQGFARSYQGLVDVISAGFPCQPFSVAGRKEGEKDSRNLWPETLRCIQIIRPRYAFLENVRGLISSGYFATILSDLAKSGYDARWRVLSAAEVGAPHKRERLWIMAYTNGQYGIGWSKRQQSISESGKTWNQSSWGSKDVAYTECLQNDREWGDRQFRWNTLGRQAEAAQCQDRQADPDSISRCSQMGDTTSEGFQDRSEESVGGQQERDSILQSERSDWWSTEPDVGRVANGVASRVDRLKAIGNGQVPQVAEAAWYLLTEG